jgi:tight adherence protein C
VPPVIIALVVGLALAALGVALIVRAALAWRIRADGMMSRIEAYGFRGRADDAVTRPSPKKTLDRAAEAMGRIIAARASSIRTPGLRQDLLRAGLHSTTPHKLIGYQAFAAVLVPLLWIWFATAADYRTPVLVLGALATIMAGWLVPLSIVRRLGRDRLGRIDDQLPELIDLLVVTVEAGLGFAGSLRLAADRLKRPLGDELRLTLQEQNLGLATSEALENLLLRADTPSMRSFVRSVVQGETLGVSIGQILRNIAIDMRKRRRAKAEEKAQKAPVKILFPLILLIFPAMFVVILVPAAFSILDAFK